LGDPSVTDIMTFPFTTSVGTDEDGEAGGEIVISVDCAREQAVEAGWSLEQELRFLVLHGLLHLSGWSDETDEKRQSMLARQATLLQLWEDRAE
jgi:probable rRNA maturation factor